MLPYEHLLSSFGFSFCEAADWRPALNDRSVPHYSFNAVF